MIFFTYTDYIGDTYHIEGDYITEFYQGEPISEPVHRDNIVENEGGRSWQCDEFFIASGEGDGFAIFIEWLKKKELTELIEKENKRLKENK